ncbi:hypothetical protein [Flavobacterium polysaccharolyticum]|uniref:Uncharacterized protein n=1 Tax=Flavobacterium polysaccharolyticum TaxID=3133148 RepID=A0ABU9NY76_9FLAO
MKKLFINLAILISSLNYAQTKDNFENLDIKIKHIELLFNEQKDNELAENICPKIVRYIGNKDSAVVVFKYIFNLIKEQKITKYKFTAGKHSKIVKSNTELQCSVPTITELENDNVIVHTESTFLFFSDDNGKNWCFAVNGENNSDYNKILNLNAEIVIPERIQKVTQKK